MNKNIFLGVLLAAITFLPLSFGFSNRIDVSPHDLWYSLEEEKWIEPLFPQIGVNAYCNQSAPHEAYIKKGSYTSKLGLQSQGDNRYSASQDITDIYRLSNSGTYTVSTTCGNETIASEFVIHNMKGEFKNVEGYDYEGKGPVYLGSTFLDDSDEIVVYVKLYDIVGSDKRDISIEDEVIFSRLYFTEDDAISFSNVDFSSDNYGTLFIIILKDLEDKGVARNEEYTLKADVEYTIDDMTKKFSFTAGRAIIFGDKPSEDETEDTTDDEEEGEKTIELSHDGDIVIDDETEKTIELIIETENIANFSIDEDDFTARIYMQGSSSSDALEVEDVRETDEDNGIWELDIADIPELDPDTDYRIEVKLEFGGIIEKEVYDIWQGIVLEGVMKDASGVVVPCEIEFVGSTNTKVTVGNDGRYRAILVSGTYDIILTYTKFSDAVPLVVKIDDVEIDKETTDMAPDPIKYSHYSKGVSIDDMAVANLLELQIALPYTSANIRMPYDESKIYDDSEIEVYRCTNWMRDRKDCVGNWVQVGDIAINTINNFISFETDTLSAFVISGRKTLELEVDDSPDNYYLGESVVLKGSVTDSNGAAVKNADVAFCIKNTDTCGSIKTDASGDFNTEFNAPESEGKFEVIVGCTKEPYHASANVSFFINTETKKEAKLTLPDMSYIVLDGKSKVSFKIKNNGQEKLSNVKLTVSAQGISRDKYTVEPNMISTLDAGAEKEIVLDIPLTTDYCMNMGCMTVYSFAIELSADELKDAVNANLIVEVKTEEDSANGTADTTEEQNSETVNAETESNDDKGIIGSIESIANEVISAPSQITGFSIGESSAPNANLIIGTIIICFIIVAIKKKKQGHSGSGTSVNPAVNAIKRHIR